MEILARVPIFVFGTFEVLRFRLFSVLGLTGLKNFFELKQYFPGVICSFYVFYKKVRPGDLRLKRLMWEGDLGGLLSHFFDSDFFTKFHFDSMKTY